MPSYRFCRTDDIPLLCRAYDSCFRIAFPHLAPLTVERFRREMRERHLWASSSMVAFEGDEPVAVLLAAKRERENLIDAIGVHPDHRRRGHGRHLVTSLRAKLAILGPPRIVVEIPEKWETGLAFFEACGFEREAPLVDLVVQPSAVAPPVGLVADARWEDLAPLVAPAERTPWDRAPEALARRRDRLRGFAIASDARVEAFLVVEESDSTERPIAAIGCADPSRAAAWLPPLVAHASPDGRLLRLQRAHPGEMDVNVLSAAGFLPDTRTQRLVAEARSA